LLEVVRDMIVTIDGPSGTGKTTISKLVAEKLGFSHFDTGAMYRSLTWFLLKNNIDLSDLAEIEKSLDRFHFQIKELAQGKRYYVNNIDVTEDIRTKEITEHVSVVSAFKFVRSLLLECQARVCSSRLCCL
jgi:cytidylate kinase